MYIFYENITIKNQICLKICVKDYTIKIKTLKIYPFFVLKCYYYVFNAGAY